MTMNKPSQLQRFLHGGKWQNFASGIATGAAYVCLSGIHWHPDWLTIIETILFLLNCSIFTVNFVLIFVSAYLKKTNLLNHFADPSTALVVPLVTIDFATICIGIYLYAHKLGSFDPYLYPMSYIGVFWAYVAFAFLTSVPVTVGWFGSVGKAHELSSFSLTGCFLVFPLMLIGTMALNALSRIPPEHPQTLAILVLGYIMQGLGFGIATCFIIVSQYRAIRYGYHRGASAATGFIACGPPGYTALALLRLGQYSRPVLAYHTPLPSIAGDILYYGVLPAVFFLLGIAFYFWLFNLIPWAVDWKGHLALNPAGCWPMTFPTSGLILTLTALGELFDATAFYVLQAILAGLIVTLYVIIFSCWLFRLFRPANKDIRDVRHEAWNKEQLSFWSSWREAELAERRYREKASRSSVNVNEEERSA